MLKPAHNYTRRNTDLFRELFYGFRTNSSPSVFYLFK